MTSKQKDALIARLLSACRAALPVVAAVTREDVWPAAEAAEVVLREAIADASAPPDADRDAGLWGGLARAARRRGQGKRPNA